MIIDSVYYKTNFPIEDYHTALLEEFEKIKEEAGVYQFKMPGISWPSHENYFLVKDNIPIAESVAQKFKELYSIEAHPRYYILSKGFHLDWHADDGTQAAFNYLITETNDPVLYRIDGNEHVVEYKKGLLNLQELHSVPETTDERVLLKLSIYNDTFEKCKEKIIAYETSNIW